MGKTEITANEPMRFIKLPELLRLLGISKSEAYRRRNSSPGFPQPIHLSKRCTVYLLGEAEAYMASCIAKRDQQRAA